MDDDEIEAWWLAREREDAVDRRGERRVIHDIGAGPTLYLCEVCNGPLIAEDATCDTCGHCSSCG